MELIVGFIALLISYTVFATCFSGGTPGILLFFAIFLCISYFHNRLSEYLEEEKQQRIKQALERMEYIDQIKKSIIYKENHRSDK